MDLAILAFQLLSYIIWACGPLVPAIIIYKLFPKDPIKVSGHILGLRINAGGAFAAYIVFFYLMSPIVDKSEEIITSMLRPTWTVTGIVKLLDHSGKEISDSRYLTNLIVEIEPNFYHKAIEKVTVEINQTNNRFPDLIIKIPNFDPKRIPIEDDSLAKKSFFRKSIDVKEIVIKQLPPLPAGCIQFSKNNPNYEELKDNGCFDGDTSNITR